MLAFVRCKSANEKKIRRAVLKLLHQGRVRALVPHQRIDGERQHARMAKPGDFQLERVVARISGADLERVGERPHLFPAVEEQLGELWPEWREKLAWCDVVVD